MGANQSVSPAQHGDESSVPCFLRTIGVNSGGRLVCVTRATLYQVVRLSARDREGLGRNAHALQELPTYTATRYTDLSAARHLQTRYTGVIGQSLGHHQEVRDHVHFRVAEAIHMLGPWYLMGSTVALLFTRTITSTAFACPLASTNGFAYADQQQQSVGHYCVGD